MINNEILQNNLHNMELREIHDYMNILQILCRRYENMLKGYYGPIDNPQEPWVRKAKDNFNFYNEIYIEMLDFCEEKVKKLNTNEINAITLNKDIVSDKNIAYDSEVTITETSSASIENKISEKKKKNVKKNKK